MIYFIRAGENGPVKIGVSADPQRRLRYFQIGNHEPLNLIRTAEGGWRQERWLHRRFSALHLRGEWHHFDPEMLTVEISELSTVYAERSVMFVDHVIEKFGGLHQMARALGHKWPTTVQGWRDRGTIPARHILSVVDAGKRVGLEFSTQDLLPQTESEAA